MDVSYPIHHAVLLDALDEGVSGPVVSNRKTEGVLCFGDLNLFRLTWKGERYDVRRPTASLFYLLDTSQCLLARSHRAVFQSEFLTG